MIPITDAEIHLLKDTSGLVLVKLTADFCGPCKLYDPVLQAFEEQTGVPVYNMNIDENPVTPRDNVVMSIPTVLVYVDGEIRDKIVGAKPLARLKKELEPWTTLSVNGLDTTSEDV